MTKRSRWGSGVCTRCNEYFEVITFWHAEKHGYKHPDEMARKADFIIWDKFTVAPSNIPKRLDSEFDVAKNDENHPIMGTKIG